MTQAVDHAFVSCAAGARFDLRPALPLLFRGVE
jgi:hypothetical protein